MEGILNCTIPGIKICILWRQIAGSALLAAVLACLYIFLHGSKARHMTACRKDGLPVP